MGFMKVGVVGSWWAVAVLGAILPNVGVGQDSPKAVASRFVEAWNERRWSEAAALLDLDQFDRFRQDFLTRARRQQDGPEITVPELLKRNPGMPREVAEYQVQQMNEQRRRYEDPTPFEFARVRGAAELRGLTVREAAARWLESRDPQYSARLQYEQAGCQIPSDLDQIPSPRRRVLGVVDGESDLSSYALVKEERSGDSMPDYYGGDLTVIELRRQSGRWVVVPRGDLLPDVGVNVDPDACRDRSRG
jgi:hypothetical protein